MKEPTLNNIIKLSQYYANTQETLPIDTGYMTQMEFGQYSAEVLPIQEFRKIRSKEFCGEDVTDELKEWYEKFYTDDAF